MPEPWGMKRPLSCSVFHSIFLCDDNVETVVAHLRQKKPHIASMMAETRAHFGLRSLHLSC